MRKFLFLDRDGVLVRFPGIGKYVTRDAQMKLVPRAAEAVALLTRAGWEMAIVSNQGCVSRRMITNADLQRMTKRMMKRIRSAGGQIGKVLYCPHQSADRCSCKKPRTRLLERAVKGRRLKRASIFYIGDSDVDIEAAANFGCKSVLVLSGRNKKKDVRSLPVKPDFIKKDLWEAANWLIKRKY